MIYLILFLALSVNASEVDVNYKWYKYASQAYLSTEEISKVENAYVDYNDYQLNEYYNIKEYEELKGRYIYVKNRSGSIIGIDSITVTNNGNNISYKLSTQFGDRSPISLSSKGVIMLDLRSAFYMKNLEIEIVYLGGDLDISFSNKGAYVDASLALERITESGKYVFSNVKVKREILYKTYYDRIDGEYRKKAYDDFIYQDYNDYKINYFFYNNTITDKNTKVTDLLDTNYTFVGFTGTIDYNKNGKYNIHLIFKECEKDIEVNVLIINESNKEKEKLINDLKEENSKLKSNIEELNNKIKEKEKLINDLKEENSELKSNIEELNNKVKEKEKLINDLKEENSELKSNIEELNDKIKEKEELINDLKEENSKLKSNIEELNDKIKEKESEIRDNKIIYEKNKINYNTIVNLKNKCFEELNTYTKIINNKNKEITYLNYKWEIDKDYYKRYIKKLKYVIDEKNAEYWNTKKSSIFVGFKTIR